MCIKPTQRWHDLAFRFSKLGIKRKTSSSHGKAWTRTADKQWRHPSSLPNHTSLLSSRFRQSTVPSDALAKNPIYAVRCTVDRSVRKNTSTYQRRQIAMSNGPNTIRSVQPESRNCYELVRKSFTVTDHSSRSRLCF